MPKSKLSSIERFYLLLNALLLLFFAAFVGYKTWGLDSANGLCYPAIGIFAIVGLLLLLLVVRLKRLSAGALALIIIGYGILLMAYDLSAPEAWVDAKGDVETAQQWREMGTRAFIAQYHRQTASEILQSEPARQSLAAYAKLLPFYPVQARLAAELKPYSSIQHNRSQHHPPLFFGLLAAWMQLSASLLSLKIFAKVLLLLYLIAIYCLLRQLLKDKSLALQITLAVGLMPALLYASQAPKNDLLLGIWTAMITLCLLRIVKVDKVSAWLHLLLGLLCTLAVLSKFTALILALPVLTIYLYRYGLQSYKYLPLVALPCLAIPILIYYTTAYDLLLNIITGRVIQDLWVAENIDAGRFIVQRLLFGQFRVGLPILILVLFTLPLAIRNKGYRPQIILFASYAAVFILLWGSSVERHQIGFLPLAIPLIGLAFSQYQRLRHSILILLLLYNLCFIFYAVADNHAEAEHVVTERVLMF